MPWAKLDDRFHEDPRLRRLYKVEPKAGLLYVASLTYASGRETDGVVHFEFVETLEPIKAGRLKRARILVDLDWWREHPEGWEIANFLNYNPSREEVRARREKRKLAGAKGGKTSNKTQPTANDTSQANAKQMLTPSSNPVPSLHPTTKNNTPAPLATSAIATENPDSQGMSF